MITSEVLNEAENNNTHFPRAEYVLSLSYCYAFWIHRYQECRLFEGTSGSQGNQSSQMLLQLLNEMSNEM